MLLYSVYCIVYSVYIVLCTLYNTPCIVYTTCVLLKIMKKQDIHINTDYSIEHRRLWYTTAKCFD